MLNLLQSLRFFIFGAFVICSAIITSVAVWNLSIVQSIASAATAKQVDAYLIFVGASGLLLIFPIIFCELASKYVFLVRVWFELLWVGSYWVMLLIGAAIITAQSNSQLCDSITGNSSFPSFTSSEQSPCASSQVLQAFTWISAILLLGYFILLSLLAFVQYKDDSTILQCRVHRFPVALKHHNLKSGPTSPLRSRFRAQSPPVIAAPTPLRIANLREAILRNYRANQSADYHAEHQQGDPSIHETTNDGHRFSGQTGAFTSNDGHIIGSQPGHATSSDGHTFAIHLPQTSTSPPPLQPLRFGQQTQSAEPSGSGLPPLQPLRHGQVPAPQPAYSPSPFYHNSVKTAINATAPQTPQPILLSSLQPQPQTSAQPEPPSPPPLGDWPRMDALSRPHTKRKPLPKPAETTPAPRPERPSQDNTHVQHPGPQSPSRMNSLTQGMSSQQHNPLQEGPSRVNSQVQSNSRQRPSHAPERPTRVNLQAQGSRPQPVAPPLARGPSQTRALPRQPPPPPPTQPGQYTFDAPALAAALQPIAAQSTSWRSKPTGPRRPSNSIDDGRPVLLDGGH